MYLAALFKGGMPCLVIGGGQVASRKIRILLETSCRITVVAPRISGFAAEEVQKGSIRWLAREYERGDCMGFRLVIAATPFREVNRAISEEAAESGIPVNVVDDPELSTVIFPAVWREGPLHVAVGSEGVAPFLAAEIRDRLGIHAKGLGRWVDIGGRFREIVRKEIRDPAERNNLYRLFIDAGPPGESEDPPRSDRLEDWLCWLNR